MRKSLAVYLCLLRVFNLPDISREENAAGHKLSGRFLVGIRDKFVAQVLVGSTWGRQELVSNREELPKHAVAKDSPG